MKSIKELVQAVQLNQTKLINYPSEFIFVGQGRSAVVFRLAHSNKAIKIFYPTFEHIAEQEVDIYRQLGEQTYYPKIYDQGSNYFVMEYISGITLYDCLRQGIEITPDMVKEVDQALDYARSLGLNPSDIHLKNIMLTNEGAIKIIDVARFRQNKECQQWQDLKKSYYKYYLRKFFPKRYPKFIIELVIHLYRYKLLPIPSSTKSV